MANKITLNDHKMAEHLLEENCVKMVFQLNINGNLSRTLFNRSGKYFSQIEAYRIGRVLILT
jgi:hypothetical protein